ncbi:MAG: hypothetical protein N2662_00700 [Bacteroidales bacterium]|nr:hypothetical protein [Bacteroidales bacterium]
MPKVGIIGKSEKTERIIKHLISANYEVVGLMNGSLTSCEEVKWTSNPFAVIAESDVLVIAGEDDGSYGLIVESIMALKPVVLDNLHIFTSEVIDSIAKLSLEASIPVVPLIQDSLLAYSESITNYFPDGICFIHGVIKGQSDLLHANVPSFSLLILLTLLFKNTIKRVQTESFFCNSVISPTYFHFSFLSGSAAIYYQPHAEDKIFTFDVIGFKKTASIDLLGMQIKMDEKRLPEQLRIKTENRLVQLINQLAHGILEKYPLSLYDLKLTVQQYKQISNGFAIKR